MTDYKTTHYDIDHESIGKQMVVLDTFKQMATVFGSDIIGASKTTPIVSGIENPASTLRSDGQIYTTVPLKPLDGDVNFLPENYLQVRFNFDVGYTTTAVDWNAKNVRHDLAIWFPSSACIPSRLQLMCGNSIIWANQFQRYEACCALASIKASYLDGDPEYASVRKIQDGKQFPGIIVTIPNNDAGTNPLKFTLNLTIDLSQLTPLLSNIPFITNDMGDIRLRIFFENLEKGMCCCWLNNYTVPSSAKQSAMIGRYPLTVGTTLNVPNADASGNQTFKINSVKWNTTGGFGVQIVQSCFKIDETSKMAIAKFIGQDNKLMIPTQTWSTVQSTTAPNGPPNQTIFQVSAYNISLLAFIFPFFQNTEVVLPNPFMESIDIQLNSKSLNFIPYDYVDNRVLKDTTQAFLNNDKYAFNEVLKNSLIPTFMENINYTDSFSGVNVSKNNSTQFIDENNYVQAISCSPINSFEKGMCLASSNPQSTQIRFKYAVAQNVREKIWKNDYTPIYEIAEVTTTTNHNPLGLDYGGHSNSAGESLKAPNAYCCALQDCIMVLDYNPVLGSCQSGTIIYAEPITI